MSKTYEFELTEENIKKYADNIESLKKVFPGEGLKKYILQQCEELLDQIMLERNVASDEKADAYVSGNKTEIGKDYVYLYNDSEIDVANADTWLNDYGKIFYPDKLSLAELVEYGTGLVGSENAIGIEDGWEYMQNTNRNYQEGWEWNNNGQTEHTQGQAGRYIYYELAEKIEENLDRWIEEYIDNAIGGNV